MVVSQSGVGTERARAVFKPQNEQATGRCRISFPGLRLHDWAGFQKTVRPLPGFSNRGSADDYALGIARLQRGFAY